jgi:hypothetical protein
MTLAEKLDVRKLRNGVVINSKQHPTKGLLHYVQPEDKCKKNGGQKTVEISGSEWRLECGTRLLYLHTERTRKSVDRGRFVDKRRLGRVVKLRGSGCLVDSGMEGYETWLGWRRPWVREGLQVPYIITQREYGERPDGGLFIDNTATGSVVAIGYSPSDIGTFFSVVGWGCLFDRICACVNKLGKQYNNTAANYFRRREQFMRPRDGFEAHEGHILKQSFLDDVLAYDPALQMAADPEHRCRRPNYLIDVLKIETNGDRVAFNKALQDQFARHVYEKGLLPHLQE